MISYGGVALISPTAELAGWIEANIPVESAFAFPRWKMLSDPTLNPSDTVSWLLEKTVGVNHLYQPWGASRWGYAFVLVDETMLGKIRTKAYLTPDKYNALPLTIDDSALRGDNDIAARSRAKRIRADLRSARDR